MWESEYIVTYGRILLLELRVDHVEFRGAMSVIYSLYRVEIEIIVF